jgi:hypothetical protein
MWPNEIRDLICIGPADHGELYPAIARVKEIGYAGSSGGGVKLYARIALLPDAHPPVQLGTRRLSEVLLPRPKRKHRSVSQLSLFDRPLDDVVIAG